MAGEKTFKFINGKEGREHLDSLSKLNPKLYRDRLSSKFWPGMTMGVFDMTTGQPRIKGKLRVLDIDVGQDGGRIQILNQVSGGICHVRHVPIRLFNFDIGLYLPQNMKVERTIKVVPAENLTLYGVAVMCTVMHRYPMLLMPPEADRLASGDEMRGMFSSDKAYNAENRRFMEAAIEGSQQSQYRNG